MINNWDENLKRKSIFSWARDYAHTKGRSYFVMESLAPYLKETILDIGSGANAKYLKTHYKERYHSADMVDCYQFGLFKEEYIKPDIEIDLEKMQIPIKPRAFDTILCCDVLEHIENMHEVYDKLFEASNKYVIISLPNNWPGFLCSFLAGKNFTHSAGYGLSEIKPKPGNRHKYFFNLEEAANFLTKSVPASHKVIKVEFLFEKDADSILSPFREKFRFIFRINNCSVKTAMNEIGLANTLIKWLPKRIVNAVSYNIFMTFSRTLDILVLGWGNKLRLYNNLCRQVWVVYERII